VLINSHLFSHVVGKFGSQQDRIFIEICGLVKFMGWEFKIHGNKEVIS